MKIIHLEDFFHPDAGYQINILPKFMAEAGHDVSIVTSEMHKIPNTLTSFFGKENIEERDAIFRANTGVDVIRLPIKRYISGRAFFSNELEKVMEQIAPEILFVHGNDTLTGVKYAFKLGRLPFPIVFDSHMLQMASKNPFNKLFKLFYRNFITPRIIRHQIPVIRTQDDDYVQKYLGIPLRLCPWISVGSDTLLFHPDKEARESFREKHNLGPQDFVIIYAGKLDESKGGLVLAETLKEKIRSSKNIVFIVVGNTIGEYGKKVEESFLESENRILRFPTQKYVDLAKFYQAADLCVFPKECSLSFYDAQACGLPVIAEDNNINIDRLSHNNGFVYKTDDISDFKSKIIQIADMTQDEYDAISSNAYNFVKENYDYEYIAEAYTEILNDEYKRFHERR